MKVFVSSTYKDLVDHRNAVREVLHRMKADVEAMEYFGARPETPEQACTKEIDECDVLIGIYAWRYGWQPEGAACSITEQEFDHAVAAGKKCLCYVLDESYPWPPAFIDKGTAARRLKLFKARVGKFVVSTFTTPDDLAKRIAADLARLLRETPAPITDLIGLDWKAFPPEVLREVRKILAELPKDAPATPADADRARFLGRIEWFGCLLYDREKTDYIPFDQDAADIFRLVGKKSLSEVYALFANRFQQDAFQTFVKLCQSIDILDESGKFTGVFIENLSPRKGQLSAPTRVNFSCTNACNFSCRHCFASSGNPYIGELTTAEIKHFIDELADMGCCVLSFGGGEPLVRADLPELIAKANARGVIVHVSTNAVAATSEVVAALKDLRISSFKVSMEGASDAVYDAIRGETGAFQAALKGIGNLKTLNVPLYLHRVFMKPNASELPELVALADKLGVQKLILETVMPVGRAAANPDLLLDWQETNRLWDEALTIREKNKWPIEIPHRVPFNARKALIKGFGCECGNLSCHVDPRGNVSPTGFLRDQLSAGNIRTQSFREIWDNSPLFTKFRNLPGNSTCAACTHLADCRGGCRARAALTDHNINFPDGNCAIAHSA